MSRHISPSKQLGQLVLGMREAFARGENVMQFARCWLQEKQEIGESDNTVLATLVAYDLQAGDYVAAARRDPDFRVRLGRLIADRIGTLLPVGGSILEVGAGESTTMSAVVQSLDSTVGATYGLDVSWSRVAVGRQWLDDNGIRATTFVGNLFNIPMRSSSVDVVYSCHSLEPNGGRERDAIAECLRVAKFGVVLVEPMHELASPEAQARMQAHGYVRGLRAAAESFDVDVLEHNLLPCFSNPLNPSGVLVLKKRALAATVGQVKGINGLWQCPITETSLAIANDCFYSSKAGIAYPVLREVPMLRAEHAIVASRLEAEGALGLSRRDL